ncbi:MAG: response regulator [Candidatus Paceibacterota bacterium]
MARILYADDYVAFHPYFLRAAKRAGHEGVAVGDAVQGWELIEKGEVFDLIISDFNMPEMDGLTFLRKVRSIDVFVRVPFVLISGNADKDKLAGVASEMGAEFIEKSDMVAFDPIITKYLSQK